MTGKKVEKKKRAIYVRKNILDIVPIRTYDNNYQCYQLKDGTYLDFLQIQSKDLINSSEDEVEFDCLKFVKMYRLHGEDLKIACMNFPCDYTKQKQFLEYKIKKCKNQIFKENLNQKLQEIIWLEKNNTTRKYYFFIFADSTDELEKNRQIIITNLGSGSGGLVEKISKEKKDSILTLLNNKCNLMHA